jgi:hypothetical protein
VIPESWPCKPGWRAAILLTWIVIEVGYCWQPLSIRWRRFHVHESPFGLSGPEGAFFI